MEREEWTEKNREDQKPEGGRNKKKKNTQKAKPTNLTC